MNEGDSFATLHISQVQNDLLSIYEKIACENGRVEILHTDGACRCVLISKAELDSLERAIEMLSDGAGVREMRDSLAQVLAQSEAMDA